MAPVAALDQPKLDVEDPSQSRVIEKLGRPPLAAGAFDLTLCANTLHHLEPDAVAPALAALAAVSLGACSSSSNDPNGWRPSAPWPAGSHTTSTTS